MNERIQELMPKPWVFPYPDREMYSKEQLEKFAELIVKECGNYLNSPEFIGRSDLDWAMVLNEYFGVKE